MKEFANYGFLTHYNPLTIKIKKKKKFPSYLPLSSDFNRLHAATSTMREESHLAINETVCRLWMQKAW
jgi:hypothetical protein